MNLRAFAAITALVAIPLAGLEFGCHSNKQRPAAKAVATAKTSPVATPAPTRLAVDMPVPGTTAPGTTATATGTTATGSPGAATSTAVPTPPLVRPARGTWLAIVYGGNTQGEIEPCG